MPKMQKIETEEKVRIIRKYLRGEIGTREGAREIMSILFHTFD